MVEELMLGNSAEKSRGPERWRARRDSNSRPIAPEAVKRTSVYEKTTIYSRSYAVLCGVIGSN